MSLLLATEACEIPVRWCLHGLVMDFDDASHNARSEWSDSVGSPPAVAHRCQQN